MTQSTNARQCNCEQALDLERRLKLCQDTAADTWSELVRRQNAELEALQKRCAKTEADYMEFSAEAGKACSDWAESHKRDAAKLEALNLTCAAQGRKLAAIEKILLGAVPRGAAHLRDVRFVSPELEAIRRAMLERPW